MFSSFEMLPLADCLISLAMLVLGILKDRNVLFIGSLIVLITAVLAALIFSSFDIAGVVLLVFGVACVVLSGAHRASSFISGRSLRQVGAMFIILGILSSLVIC